MKIVHVIFGYLPEVPGGPQIHVRDLAQVQQAQGHQVEVFSRIGGAEHPELTLNLRHFEGVPVTCLTNNFLEFNTFESQYRHAGVDDRFRSYLQGTAPDVVHVHHPACLSTSLIEVATDLGIPVVLTLHDYWLICPRGQRLHPDDLSICSKIDRKRCLPCLQRLWPHLLVAPEKPPDSRLARLLHKDPLLEKLRLWDEHTLRMLKLCRAVVAPSRFHLDRFIEWGLPRRNTHVVENGLPRQQLLAEPRGARPVQIIGYIGTVIPSKGAHVLVEAFNLLHRSDLALQIHGEIVPYHERAGYIDELQELVQPGLDVTFHDTYDNRDLPEILAGFDLLVVPPLWWEPFGLTAREGALAGLPVIAADVGGLSRVVADGLALGFPAGNAAALAVVIERLCQTDQLRDEMSRKADLVLDMADCAARLEEIYRSAGGNAG